MSKPRKAMGRTPLTTSGRRLAFARQSAGFESSSDLHEALQKMGYRVTRAGVAHWEKDRNDISADAAQAISRLTGVSPGWLLFNAGPVFLNDPATRLARRARFLEERDRLGKAYVTRLLTTKGAFSAPDVRHAVNDPLSSAFDDEGASRIETALGLRFGDLDRSSPTDRMPLPAWFSRTLQVLDALPENERDHALSLLEAAARLVKKDRQARR